MGQYEGISRAKCSFARFCLLFPFYEHENIPEWLLSLLVTRAMEKTRMDGGTGRNGTIGSLAPVVFLISNPEYR